MKNIIISYETSGKNEIYLDAIEKYLLSKKKRFTKILIPNKSNISKKNF